MISNRFIHVAAGCAVLGALVAGYLAGARNFGLLGNTLLVIAGTLAIALPTGTFLALTLAKLRLPGRKLALVLLGTLLLAPLHLQAAAWRAGFGTLGWYTQSTAGNQPVDPLLSGMPGAIWVHAVGATAWIAMIMLAGLSNVDRRLEEEALQTHSPWRVLWRVSLRSAAPAAVVAGGWVLVSVAQEMVVTDLFQVRTFAEETYTQCALGLLDAPTLLSPGPPLHAMPLLLGLASICLLAIALFWWGATWLDPGPGTSRATGWYWQPDAGRRWLSLLLWMLMLLLVALPVGSLFYKAGGYAQREGDQWTRHWKASKAIGQVLQAPVRHRREIGQSLKLGLAVAGTSVALGWWLAPLVAKPGWLRLALLAAAAICLTLPGPILGLVAIRLLNQPDDSWLGPLGWLYHHTLFAPWLVQTVRIAPLTMLMLGPLWRSLPTDLLETARLDGQPGWWVGLRARPLAVLVIAMVTLALSLGELSATLLVMPPGDTTLTIQLFNLLHSGVDDRVAAISLGMLFFTALIAWTALYLWEHATIGKPQ